MFVFGNSNPGNQHEYFHMSRLMTPLHTLTHSCSLHHTIYLYLYLYLPLCPPGFRLSHTHPDKHSHISLPSKSGLKHMEQQSPPCAISSVRACTPTRNYSAELEKPDVNLDSV